MKKQPVPEQHQFRIAKQTLGMSDAMVAIMGSMTKEEARTILRERAGWTQERIEEYENEAS